MPSSVFAVRALIAALVCVCPAAGFQAGQERGFAEGAYEARLLEEASTFEMLDHPEGLNNLLGVLEATFERYPTVRPLQLIEHSLRRPLSLDAVEAEVSNHIMAIRDADSDALPAAVEALVVRTLDLRTEAEQPASSPEFEEHLLETVRHMARSWRLRQSEHPKRVEAVQRALEIDSAWVTARLEQLKDHWASPIGRGDIESVLAMGLPDAHADEIDLAVDGQWHHAFLLADGSVLVIGSDEQNTYDMSRIDHVIDPGGDDTYTWPEGTAPSRIESIIDLAGNDTYITEADFAGPATTAFGWSLLIDQAGDDRYRSRATGSIAFGAMGMGVLIDHAGDDVYEATGERASWTIGAGFFGAGVLIDRGGHDVYRGEKLTQAVGGARGLGAIIDQAGNDFYFANGPSQPSAYGTAGVYLGKAQGFAYGVRGHAAGGVAALYDLGGHDEYTGGEFSQGGGYFFGLGILRDAAGRDLYHANRYGQAFAAHQAAGILIDDQGDDTYWTRTAAGQSGSWDECVTLFIDRAGNDAYRCDGLGMGGAAMQAIAVFIDEGGSDRYAPAGRDTLGESSRDTYHYERTGALSFSAFMDLGSGMDIYPPRRSNDSRHATGSVNEADPQQSTRFGFFIDE